MVVQLLVLLGLLAGWLLGKAIGSDGFINNSRLFGVLYVFATIVSKLAKALRVAWRIGQQ